MTIRRRRFQKLVRMFDGSFRGMRRLLLLVGASLLSAPMSPPASANTRAINHVDEIRQGLLEKDAKSGSTEEKATGRLAQYWPNWPNWNNWVNWNNWNNWRNW